MSTSVTAAGRELIEGFKQIEFRLTEWILQLADFDAGAGWREDGFTSCQAWLEVKCCIGWSTAKERVRVARELTHRPVVRAAFAEGRLTYSKARVITRLRGLDNERDETFVRDAAASSVRALDERVHNWNYLADQDRKPRGLDDLYGLTWAPGFADGLGRLTIETPNDLGARAVKLIDAYLNWLFHRREPTLLGTKALGEPETRSRSGEDDDVPLFQHRSLAARRADAFFDLLEEIALVHEEKIDPESAALNVTVQYEDLIRGVGVAATEYAALLTGEAARRLACDGGIHRIIVNGISEVLDVGRKTRTWTRAQRRVIRARHGFRCAAGGCHRRITQIHHIHWWENGGVTSVDNGVPLCSYHHHLVHEGGWAVAYNPRTGVTRMEGPQGQVLESDALFLYAA
jgi:hypothetical protein